MASPGSGFLRQLTGVMYPASAVVAAVSLSVLAGCSLFRCEDGWDAEGFIWTRGTSSVMETPGDNYIIRYELVSTGRYEHAWMNRLPVKWDFIELRQLNGTVTEIRDGVWRRKCGFNPGCNWRRWVDYGARNVRVRFVSADYDPAKDGVEPAPDGFVSLFNGKDLSGWRGMVREGGFECPHVRRAMMPEKRWEYEAKGRKIMAEHWSVRDGTLFFDGRPGGYNIAAEKQYGNFEAIVDWRFLRVCGDSGIFLRGLPQVQLWDPDMWDGIGSGCIWNNRTGPFSSRACADRPIGDWNRCRIRLVGERVWVWVNDVCTVDGIIYENLRQPGLPIPLIDNFELQCHGDPVQFRNVFIRELPEEDVPDPASAGRGRRIDLLKDGLAGWEAVDPKARMGWSVKDGVLSNYVTDTPEKVHRGGSGGTHLKTKRADFYDFDLSYDVLVGKRCNSGVYLRGRYEIQANDSYGRKPGCHNMGALYDLLSPSVAAEKPAGEWQHIDLTLYRRHLTVVLNGVKIIDNRPVAGVTPGAVDGNEFVPGPILLQGDHSNVSFRNMFLTPILDGDFASGDRPGFSVFAAQIIEHARRTGMSVTAAAAAFREAGIEGFDCHYADADVPALVKGGLVPVNFYGVMKFLGDDGGLAQAEKFIAEALKYGVPRVMVLPDEFTGADDEAEFAKIVEGVRTFVRLAGEKGLVVTTEDFGYRRKYMNPCGNSVYIRRLLDEVPELMFTVDSGNLHVLEGRNSIMELTRATADRIRHVHLKDCAASAVPGKRGPYVTLGTGEVPNREIVRFVSDLGYRGWYTLENLTGNDLLEDAVRQMATVRRWTVPAADAKR